MLPLADSFAQLVFMATLWIFSMGGVDVGALLLSAWLEVLLLRHHCRIKDWRYLQEALRFSIQVCDFFFTDCFTACCVCCDGRKMNMTWLS